MDYEQIACMIIADAGDSRGYSMEAIEAAKRDDFEEAMILLQKGKDACLQAHKIHTQLLTQEANKAEMEVNFLLVHASNHLTIAEVTSTMAELFIDIMKEVKK